MNGNDTFIQLDGSRKLLERVIEVSQLDLHYAIPR